MNTVDEYKGFLDKSYDPTFETLSLPWRPWVGSSFRNTKVKTIVLGESIYVWGEVAEHEKTFARINERDSLRQRHLRVGLAENFKKGDRKRAYLANFERAVFLKTQPSALERQRLWSQVAYFNLVPRTLKSRRHRPTVEDFETGWQQFFRVAGALDAQRCIVYGTEGKKIDTLLAMPDVTILQKERILPTISDVKPLHLRVLREGKEMEFLFIRHPSAFFAWQEWGHMLRARDICLDSAYSAANLNKVVNIDQNVG
jgi:hypothetical protein